MIKLNVHGYQVRTEIGRAAGDLHSARTLPVVHVPRSARRYLSIKLCFTTTSAPPFDGQLRWLRLRLGDDINIFEIL
jgi:hypothetical protein